MPAAPARAAAALLLLASSGAHADPDPTRCARGLEARAAGDLARAHLLLEDCEDGEAARARREVRRALEEGEFAPVSIAVKPEAATLELSIAPGVALFGSQVVWLPIGRHRLRAAAAGHLDHEQDIAVENRNRLAVVVTLARAAGPRDREVDFGEEEGGLGAGQPIATADPRPRDHGSLMPERFRKEPVADAGARPGDRPPRAHVYLYLGAGAALFAGGALHIYRGGGDRARPYAYGLYGAGAVLGGLGAYAHVRARRQRAAALALAPLPSGRGLVLALTLVR